MEQDNMVPAPPELSDEALIKETIAQAPLFAPSKEAQYPFGIVYKAPWETEYDGVAIAARRAACAIRRTGVPVFLQSENHMFIKDGIVRRVIYSELPDDVLHEIDHISDIQHRQTVLTVRHVVPTKSKLESILYPREICAESKEFRELFRKTLVLYSAWEHNVIEKDIVKLLNFFGRLWVPCRDNKRWLEASGVDASKIEVMPHPLALRDPMRSTKRSTTPRPYRFLNISKWEPRKAQHDLIGGFLIAFKPADDVQLVMKANPFARIPGTYPESPGESLKQWLKDSRVKEQGWTTENISPRVEILWPRKEEGFAGTTCQRQTVLTRKQMAVLYAQCDCYVSAGRCEGFDLPAFDAKVMGLQLIAPLFGGPKDFLTMSDTILGQFKDISYKPEPWYMAPEECRWASHNELDVALAMREAYETRKQIHLPFPAESYSIDVIGKRMRESLNKLAAELGFDLAAINVDAEK